jgi:hypothetical protein
MIERAVDRDLLAGYLAEPESLCRGLEVEDRITVRLAWAAVGSRVSLDVARNPSPVWGMTHDRWTGPEGKRLDSLVQFRAGEALTGLREPVSGYAL